MNKEILKIYKDAENPDFERLEDCEEAINTYMGNYYGLSNEKFDEKLNIIKKDDPLLAGAIRSAKYYWDKVAELDVMVSHIKDILSISENGLTDFKALNHELYKIAKTNFREK